LVTGANGYIGSAVARAVRRNGHTVYGLIRSEDQAPSLVLREIIPVVVSNFSDLKSYSKIVDEVSVVVDTVSTSGLSDPYSPNRALMQTMADFYLTTGIKKRYIYTSGCLVYGDHPNQILDESVVPTGNKVRAEFEKEVTRCLNIEGVVLRPGWTYGGTGGHYIDNWYGVSAKGEIDIYGNPNKTWGWVHITDLADAFSRVIEAPSAIVSGQIYNVMDGTRITVGQAREAMARAAGFTAAKVVHYPAGTDAFSKLAENNIVCSYVKINRAVGWQPKNGPFLDNIHLYAASAKAAAVLKAKK